ncbi:MAG: fluoride efflux transporter CrcB [Robiginitomaculum sp.]|nr:fluoride efflux transporter CrcB [Robiginitomaculum sp.]
MNGILYVALGGALGASGRHLLGSLALRTMGPGYPYGTLAVNVFGGFLMGLLVGWLALKGSALAGGANNLRLFLAVGVLGGFTTFSAFSLDAMRMIETKAYGAALGYISASVVFSILALFIGLVIARKVFGA